MYQNIKKMTLLLFVAATMLSFTACEKDDDATDTGIQTITPTENDIIGTWLFDWNGGGNYWGEHLYMRADHKMLLGDYSTRAYDWTLKGNTVEGYIEFDERDMPQGRLWWEKVTFDITDFRTEKQGNIEYLTMTISGCISNTYYGFTDTADYLDYTLTRSRSY